MSGNGRTLQKLVITLLLANFAFTAGAYIFAWTIYREVKNHHETRLRQLEKEVFGVAP